jgi:hypothetical protein
MTFAAMSRNGLCGSEAGKAVGVSNIAFKNIELNQQTEFMYIFTEVT